MENVTKIKEEALDILYFLPDPRINPLLHGHFIMGHMEPHPFF